MTKLTDLLMGQPERHDDVEWVINSAESGAREVFDRINAMWVIFSKFADENFVVEFANQPNVRYWEMFLGYHFEKQDSVDVSAPKPGPDLAVRFGQHPTAFIEAVCLSPGEIGRSATLAALSSGKAEWWPSDRIALRFTAAMNEKLKKLDRWREVHGLFEGPSPYVIAINSSNLAGRMATDEDALSAIYPFQAHSTTLRCGPDGEILEE